MLNLYRGDTIFNLKSKPWRYYSEGLTSSAFGAGGDAENIEKITFLKTVKQHVDHLKRFEKEYYKITDYISFSESEETAKFWASDRGKGELTPCNPLEETRYVFKLCIFEKDLKSISKGIWSYHFACNKNLKSSYSSELAELLNHCLRYQECPICGGLSKNHSLILIDPFEVLSSYPDEKDFEKAKNFAKTHKEWLVLPTDLIINSNQRSTRIPRADFWTVDHYKFINETREILSGIDNQQ